MSEKSNEQQVNKKIGKRGFYIVLAVCIIAVAGILFAAMTPQETEKAEVKENEIRDVQSIESPTLDEQLEKEDTEEESAKTDAPAETDESEADDDMPASQESSVTPENMQRAEISIMRPLKGEILTAFEIDKLVFNSTLNIWQTHSGVDIVPADAAEVSAALAGEVESVENDPTMGIYVTIKHSDNLKTKYAGLTEASVEAGDKVEKGDVIGVCGTPPFEADMGPHLHFELWDGTSPIDPASVFEQ